ncbi:MAG: hypothetical protein ACLQVW_19675, partial [Limisphaerales bacterium]
MKGDFPGFHTGTALPPEENAPVVKRTGMLHAQFSSLRWKIPLGHTKVNRKRLIMSLCETGPSCAFPFAKCLNTTPTPFRDIGGAVGVPFSQAALAGSFVSMKSGNVRNPFSSREKRAGIEKAEIGAER